MLFSLEGGLAVGEVPIKAQPQNAHWIDTCFGEEMTKELGDAPISCAGVWWGVHLAGLACPGAVLAGWFGCAVVQLGALAEGCLAGCGSSVA